MKPALHIFSDQKYDLPSCFKNLKGVNVLKISGVMHTFNTVC